MMDEDAISSLSVRVKLNLTVWDFTLPATPSLPAVFGVSCSHLTSDNKLLFTILSENIKCVYCLKWAIILIAYS